jgi:hypothetical protein
MSSAGQRLTEFFATLDVAGDEPIGKPAGALPETLRPAFPDAKEFYDLLGQVQAVGSRAHDVPSQKHILALILENDPRLFLVLSHLHRQIRFTNVEIARTLFDPKRLDDPDYYTGALTRDPEFRRAYSKARKWRELELSGVNSRTGTLAAGKKAISGYMGSEERCWELWLSRIRSDPETRERVIDYLFDHEDLGELIQEGAIEQALRRSLRTTNVEKVKSLRGTFGAGKIRRILQEGGFTSTDHEGEQSDISDLPQLAKRNALVGPLFASEVNWEKEKRFDFALFNQREVRFVVETTYYSTSMSKIGEVIKHFEDLRAKCADSFHLFFLTDGIGWFGKVKDIRRMLGFGAEAADGTGQFPYLLTYHQFTDLLPEITKALNG